MLTWQDLMRIDSERARDIRVTIVEGLQLLGNFDARLREYAADKLHKQGVNLVKVPPRLPGRLQNFQGMLVRKEGLHGQAG